MRPTCFADGLARHFAAVLLPALLLVLLAPACSRRPEVLDSGRSVILVTFGRTPATVLEAQARTEQPATTNAPAGALHALAASGAKPRLASVSSLDVLAEATSRIGPPGKSLLDRFAERDHDVAAILADPALAPFGAASGPFHDAGGLFLAGASLRNAHVSHLAPRPFDDPGPFLRSDIVTARAITWIAARAGIPLRRPAKDAPPPAPPALKRPFFLWIHLADPAFRDAIRIARATDAPPASRLENQVHAMDRQIGAILAFLTAHGLREGVDVAVLGIEGDALSTEEAAATHPGPDRALAFELVPAALAELLPPAPEASPDALDISPEAARLNGLAYRLRHPSPHDETLLADCEAYRDAHADSADAHCWVGIAQRLARHPDLALASHRRAFELEPGSPFRMSNLGLAFWETGDVIHAIDQLENAYLANPDDDRRVADLASALLQAGNALAMQNRPDDAAACLSRVVSLQPGNPAGHLAQGRLYEKTGQPRLAEAAYRKALQLRPGYRPAAAALKALLASRESAP